MENELIVIAKREDAKRNISGALSTFLLFTAFLVIDIIFYLRDGSTWQLVLLIISAVLDAFAVLGLLFAWSNFSYAKKIIDTPLIKFDGTKSAFIVTDCIFKKEVDINKDDVIEVKISDKGETYMWYKKDSKKSSMFIGYSNKGSEDLINNELQKYKNIYC
ncbi:MAG: hypothetical protein K6E87_02255 [bacterium]|nr:hypothetical protein [bacterium]